MSLYSWDKDMQEAAGIHPEGLNVVSKLLSKQGRLKLPRGYDRIGPREMTAMLSAKTLEKIHRVQFIEEKIYVLSLGLDADSHEQVYVSTDTMPDWMQDRLSVLLMMDPTPPTKYVDGVGRRIAEDIFWVVEP